MYFPRGTSTPPVEVELAGQPTDTNPVDFFPYIVAWNVLQTFGLSSLSAIVLTVVLAKIQRTSTWILFVASGILNTTAYLLIVTRQIGSMPPRVLCLIQAMLVYACPPFNAACGISFMLQTYILIRSLKKSRGMCCPSKITLWLLIAPFFVLWAIILEVLVVYLLDPSSLSRDLSGMYCSLGKNPIPVKVSSAVVILAGTTVLVLQGLIFLSLRRNWRQNVQDLRGSKISLTVLLRAVIFGFVAAVAVGMSFAYSATTSTGTALSNLPMAIVPVMDALIFGTQKDILSVWMFWREKSN